MMALIVTVTRPVKTKPVEAVCFQLIFEDEKEGRQYVKDHATFVLAVQKGIVVSKGVLSHDSDFTEI